MSELNEKIENLNLVSLRKYACAKVNGEKEWYLKCLECSGVDDCSCGRRARDILESQTKPGKRKKDMPSDEVFMKAYESGNPRQWLYRNGYYRSLASAGNSFNKWFKRTGKISDEDLGAMRKKIRKCAGKMAGEASVAKERKRIIDVFEGKTTDFEKRIAALEAHDRDCMCKSVYNSAFRWRGNCPDLEEKYHFMDACRIFGAYENRNKTVQDMLNELSAEPASDDEVSVEDFLNETETDIPEKAAEPVRELPKPATDAAEEHVDASPSQEVLRYEFGKKRLEFLNRLKKLEEAKKLIDEEAEDLKKQITLLDQTAEMFGMKAVRSINCKPA